MKNTLTTQELAHMLGVEEDTYENDENDVAYEVRLAAILEREEAVRAAMRAMWDEDRDAPR
jgi:DNA-binding XRE family transcriptional regulator